MAKKASEVTFISEEVSSRQGVLLEMRRDSM